MQSDGRNSRHAVADCWSEDRLLAPPCLRGGTGRPVCHRTDEEPGADVSRARGPRKPGWLDRLTRRRFQRSKPSLRHLHPFCLQNGTASEKDLFIGSPLPYCFKERRRNIRVRNNGTVRSQLRWSISIAKYPHPTAASVFVRGAKVYPVYLFSQLLQVLQPN